MANKGKKVFAVNDRPLRQFLNGLIICCIIVTIVASALAGARIITIVYRSTAVYLILWLVGSIIKRYWANVSYLRQENAREERKH